MYRPFFLNLFALTIIGCQTSKVTVSSTPSKAIVEIYNPASDSYEKAGKTPLSLSDQETKIPLSILHSELVSMRITAPGYMTEQILLEKSGRPQIKVHANLQSTSALAPESNDHTVADEVAKYQTEIKKFVDLKEVPKAIEQAEKLTASYPKSYYAWSVLGSLYLASGDKQSAKRAYEKSIELNPNNIEISLILKMIGG